MEKSISSKIEESDTHSFAVFMLKVMCLIYIENIIKRLKHRQN